MNTQCEMMDEPLMVSFKSSQVPHCVLHVFRGMVVCDMELVT